MGEADANILTLREGSGGTVEMKTKQLRRVYSNTALELRQIVREIEVLQGIKHDSIVEMREYFISEQLAVTAIDQPPKSAYLLLFVWSGTHAPVPVRCAHLRPQLDVHPHPPRAAARR